MVGLANAQKPTNAIFEGPTLYCPNRRHRPPDWRIWDLVKRQFVEIRTDGFR
jgi:hypothetical protein